MKKRKSIENILPVERVTYPSKMNNEINWKLIRRIIVGVGVAIAIGIAIFAC